MTGSLVNAIKKSTRTRKKAEAKQKERNEKRSIKKKIRRAEEKKYDTLQRNLALELTKEMNSD